jgi:hypothetical protein
VYGIEPPAWMDELAATDASVVELASIVLEGLLFPKEYEFMSFWRRQSRAWRYMWLQGKKSRMAHHLRGLAMQPIDADHLALPDSLFWLYYVLRPFLWLWRRCQRSTP